jgi:hypothetical protein
MKVEGLDIKRSKGRNHRGKDRKGLWESKEGRRKVSGRGPKKGNLKRKTALAPKD